MIPTAPGGDSGRPLAARPGIVPRSTMRLQKLPLDLPAWQRPGFVDVKLRAANEPWPGLMRVVCRALR